MKGIILAGGLGTRLYPATQCISKQLLPIYDKPMVYYPLCTLMSAGIRDILIITTPHELSLFQQLLGTGEQWGIKLQYQTQAKPGGIAEAFIIGAEFIGADSVCLILGDNILHGEGLAGQLRSAAKKSTGATIFSYYVSDPARYGVVQYRNKKPIAIIEKPKEFISNYAVIGLYFFDAQVVEIARSLKPSARGELEITDVSQAYLDQGKLEVVQLSRGIAWLDTGTPKSLLDASNFIYVLEERQGLKIGSPEEIAWRAGFINSPHLKKQTAFSQKNTYGKYLQNLVEAE